ncbi:hypothetical protein PC115_g17151 [Phytophthora cactorum]|uniref:Armadillo repeat-containing domain-containing protein n=1 Tax=Phytophthora cactorum TaxID=29920 RepID=A0A8T1B9A9_9STRA|nr:hypothetical protein PC115_g17151 [Phytophthora cactorum]
MELTPSCDGVYPEKQHALSALLHLSAGSDEVKAKMAADGVIRALVRLVCSDGRMKQVAAFALENLSAYHDIFDIMSPYGIPPLVALLRVGTLSQKGNAVVALFNRAGYDDNRPVIVRAGVIPPLMELMQDDFGVLQEQVVQVLALLSEAPILRSGNPGEKEYTARALASLSLSDANKKDIASADGIACLIRLKRVGDINQKTYASKSLSNLSTDADARAVIEYANENALEELYDFHAIDAHDSATTAELILSMVREGDSVQQIQGLLMLLVWSAAEKNVNSIVAAGGVSLVMKTLNATVALANLASSAESQEVIASAGGIFPLLKLVSEGNDHQRENAALALANLSENNANRDAIVSAGIPAFVAMVRDGSVRHQINATLALRNLSTIDKGRLAIAQTGGIPPLVSLLGVRHLVQNTKVLSVLENLSLSGDCCEKLVAAGAIPLLVKLLRVDDIPTQQSATVLLANLSSDEATIEASGSKLLDLSAQPQRLDYKAVWKDIMALVKLRQTMLELSW